MKLIVNPAILIAFTLPFTSQIAQGQVIISEICTENTRVDDEDTDSPDWFELRNVSDASVSLEGWQLSVGDDASTPPWAIRHLALEPGDVRLFFASGKNRPGTPDTIETYRPHTDFSLSNDGGDLALLDPEGNEVAALTYPPLGKNVGYGVKDGKEGFLFPVTPNEPNVGTPSPKSLAPDVVFSHPGGIVSGPTELTMEVPEHPEAVIQYAFDGAEPSLFTPTYSGPITIEKTTTIVARAILPDHLPSRLQGIGFIVLDDDLKEFAQTGETFSSNLPVLVMDTLGQNIESSRAFKSGYISVNVPDPSTGRAVLGAEAEYAGPCALHVRGESSSGFGQKSYALEIQDEDTDDNDVSLLGMPAESDWVLYGPWSEKTLMRNKLIYDWMRELRGDDGTSVRSEFCEVFLNQRGSETLGYSAYQGVYLLIEKIKSGRDRVPVEAINEYTVDPQMITGGYIIRKDKVDGGKDSWTTGAPYNIPMQSFDPDRFNQPQLDYIKGYLSGFQNALRGDDFTHPTRGYHKYIEADTFIDAQWFVEIMKQVDGYVFSTYWHKPRNGRLRAGPLWDFNISMGNADYATGDQKTGWLYGNAGGRGQLWFPRLHADPEYHIAHWDRYWHMRHTLFSDEAVDEVIDRHMATLLDGYAEPVGNREPDTIQNPVARHFRKYPFLGNRQWPNPPAETSIDDWQEEVEYMRDWFKDRLDWIDDESLPHGRKVYRAPRLSEPSGPVAQGAEIAVIPHKGGLFDANKYPTETVYYTTDGSDPRLPGDELNPNALTYSEPIVIEDTTTIQARIFHDDHWSPKTSGTFLVNPAPASGENLMITEIMYHPTDPTGIESFSGLTDSGFFEYIELTNLSSQVVDLSGVSFTRGVQFQFDTLPDSERLISPHSSILLVNHREGFARRYGDVDAGLVRGTYLGRLDNGGERIFLENAAGESIVDLEYDDDEPWPLSADGEGFSLVWSGAKDAELDEVEAWVVSEVEGGTPGTHPMMDDGNGGSGGEGPSDAVDTDRDGLSDLVETRLGSDPQDPQSRYLPTLVSQDTPEPAFQLQLRHRSALQGEDLILEQSTDLSLWEPLPTEQSVVLESHDNETVTRGWLLDPVQGGVQTFLRIRIARE